MRHDKYSWRGQTYRTVEAAAEAMGIAYGILVWRRRQHGNPTCLDGLESAKDQPSGAYTWRGAEYPTLAAAARAMGIPWSTLKDRWRQYQKPSCLDGLERECRGLRLPRWRSSPQRDARLAAIPGPGSWEREHLAGAGQHGYSGGRESGGGRIPTATFCR